MQRLVHFVWPNTPPAVLNDPRIVSFCLYLKFSAREIGSEALDVSEKDAHHCISEHTLLRLL